MVWYIESLIYIFELFKYWLEVIFVAPIKTLDMLWLLVPIWLGWFFTEFFQEKKGTGMGNAVTNSVIVIWAGIDAVRQTIRLSAQGLITGTFNIISRYIITFFLLLYGVFFAFPFLHNKVRRPDAKEPGDFLQRN